LPFGVDRRHTRPPAIGHRGTPSYEADEMA
jgi:hypothetical protein